MTKKKQPNDTAPVGRTAELRVERMALADMRPHPRNPRHHPDPGTPAWDSLRASLEHDYFDPLVVNVRPGPEEFMLVSGHLRRKVLIAAGYTHADVAVVDYDSATHLARLLAANNLQGKNIEEDMRAVLVDLAAVADFDLSLTGFDIADIDGIIGRFSVDPLADPPALPDGDKTPFVNMTFTLHDSQAEVVRAALSKAKDDGVTDSAVNENGNGNALTAIAVEYLG